LVTDEMDEYAQWLLGTSLYDFASAGAARASAVACSCLVLLSACRPAA
jgi:hypothetical protein